MQVRVGIESGFENRSLAYALDFPGCFAYGADDAEALLRIPHALLEYYTWVEKHTDTTWLPELGDFDVRLMEVWNTYFIDDTYELNKDGWDINAWFRNDWKPLSMSEVRHGLAMLSWSRADLLSIVNELTPAQLNKERPGERWTIAGILGHIANSELWYLDRLNQAPIRHAQLPADPYERLALTRGHMERALPDLAGLDIVVGKNGEFWSPRKLLRRTLWHEKDHIGHILRLILEEN